MIFGRGLVFGISQRIFRRHWVTRLCGDMTTPLIGWNPGDPPGIVKINKYIYLKGRIDQLCYMILTEANSKQKDIHRSVR